MLRTILRIFTWWHGETLNTQFWCWRNGLKIGEDSTGNRFYQNHDGSRRWVIYKGDIDASRVSPEWHGWLHQTYQDPPTVVPLLRKSWEKEHHENLTGTTKAYVPTGSLRKKQRVLRSDYEAWTP